MNADVPPTRMALLGLSMELYRKMIPGVIPKYEAFHRVLGEKLKMFGEVLAGDLCFSREEVERAVAAAESSGADVLVVVLHSYHPSLNSLSALSGCKLPVLVWNTQRLREIGPDYGVDEMLENHGMHGVQDLCSCLRRAGR